MTDAKNRKNPISSKKTDIIVMDKKRARIFKGLITLLAVKPEMTSGKEINPKDNKIDAPIRGISQ